MLQIPLKADPFNGVSLGADNDPTMTAGLTGSFVVFHGIWTRIAQTPIAL